MGTPASSCPTKAGQWRGGGMRVALGHAVVLMERPAPQAMTRRIPPLLHAAYRIEAPWGPDTFAAWPSRRVDRKIVS